MKIKKTTNRSPTSSPSPKKSKPKDAKVSPNLLASNIVTFNQNEPLRWSTQIQWNNQRFFRAKEQEEVWDKLEGEFELGKFTYGDIKKLSTICNKKDYI